MRKSLLAFMGSFYGTILFPAALVGPEGIWSYDIKGTAYMVVVAWSVPWNDAIYDEKFNVKVKGLRNIYLLTSLDVQETSKQC